MTENELQTVVAAVIQSLKTNGKTIAQLTPVTSLANSDSLEVSGGKKIAFSKLKELVASAVVVTQESIKGWVVIESTDDLPEEPTPEEQMKAYVLADESTLYVYVGEGGDTLGGKWQSAQLQGPKGNPGTPLGETEIVDDLDSDAADKVLSAKQGKVLKGMIGNIEIPVVNDLTTGGEASALSAEMGKELEVKKMDKVEIVNDLFGGEETDVLGAEQGAVLDKKIISLYSLFESLGMELPYIDKHWLDVGYGVGDNLTERYNAWAPNCAHYDSVRGRIMFMQCHRTRHGNGDYINSQLWAINPYNVLEKELIAEFEPVANNKHTNLAFDIDSDGNYWTINDLYVFKSEDRGNTWQQQSVVTKPRNIYGLWIIDGKMYVGDDGDGGRYWVSTDGGINFLEHTFDIDEDYTIAHCEATFAKFQGKLYAAIRRDDALGLLLRQGTDGTWSVLCENLPNLNSDCSLVATKDTLLFAAINRPDRSLTFGSIDFGNETTINKLKVFTMDNYGNETDYHCPALVYTTDFIAITFFINVAGGSDLRCNNACVVAYYDMQRNENPHYVCNSSGILNREQAWFKTSPYIGTAPTTNALGFTTGLAYNSVYDCTIPYPGAFPTTEDGAVLRRVIPNSTNVRDYSPYDGGYVGNRLVCCTTVGTTSPATRPERAMRFMFEGKFEEYDYSSVGTIEPSGAQLDRAVVYSQGALTAQAQWLATLCPPVKRINRFTKEDVVTFTALEDCVFSLTVGMNVNRYALKRVRYSLDNGRSWTTTENVDNETITIQTPTVHAGESVWWRGEGDRFCIGVEVDDTSRFNSTGRFNVAGNILALLYGNDTNDTKFAFSADGWGSEYAALFMGCTTLVNVARNFLAAATIVGRSSFARMFNGCTALVAAPELPATNIGASAYDAMFMGCTSLVSPPSELPADVIPNRAYGDMFNGCTSLVESPIIRPHRILTQQQQLQRMFMGCTSLRKITILNGEYGGIVTLQWARGVPTGSGGTFVTSGTWTTRGESGVPAGWEIVTVDADTLEPIV